METQLRWAGGAAFIGLSSGGHTVVMDGPPEGGGRNLGPRPMEMLLLSMGACSTYDVVSILQKSRQGISECEVKITANRADEHPKIFTDIHIHYKVSGKGLTEKSVKRAIQLSAEKYCSASIMLGAMAKITHDYEIIEIK
ncbi:MAG: OsmC/Ohr family protein [Gammaproteobacteria bacterium]|nr:OsmC/Ohr family protein [Gammaproteobacteria bacterium]